MNGRGYIVITIGQRDRELVLTVKDSGPGVPMELRDRIFEPFFTTKARGGGLGLPIARRTAELHGGSLTLASPPDGGAIFTLTLPLHALPEPVSA
jgi:signal transduction histidine kinase